MSTIGILLADEHQVVREGLRSLLEEQKDFQVIAETGSGIEAVRLAENLKPDVLILDMMMPDLYGIEVARQVSKSCPGCQIVVLSMCSDEAYVVEALRSGAKAYVLKESSSADLVRAVRAVREGRRYLSPSLSERAIEVYTQAAEGTALKPYDTLTTREREVLHMAAQGLTNAEIAKRLFIGQRTVETHRNNLMRKLRLRNQTDLIRYAIRSKIVPLNE